MQKKYQRRGWIAAAALGPLFTPMLGHAQNAADPATELEEVTVTGSRIKRPNIESASPVTVMDVAEIKYQGTTSIETALNRLPQFTADSNENGSNGSDGTARVNLRDLGSNRVLVLVDGQRMLPVETADVNFIPSSLLERVDVVTGGASAVYGSDAVAGVVNFIMKKNLQGLRMDVQYGIANHNNDNSYVRSVIDDAGYQLPKSSLWDGARTDVNLSLGMNTEDGRGNEDTGRVATRILPPSRSAVASTISSSPWTSMSAPLWAPACSTRRRMRVSSRLSSTISFDIACCALTAVRTSSQSVLVACVVALRPIGAFSIEIERPTPSVAALP